MENLRTPRLAVQLAKLGHSLGMIDEARFRELVYRIIREPMGQLDSSDVARARTAREALCGVGLQADEFREFELKREDFGSLANWYVLSALGTCFHPGMVGGTRIHGEVAQILVHDPDPIVRSGAADALVRVRPDDPATARALLTAIQDDVDPMVRRNAASTLRDIHHRDPAVHERMLELARGESDEYVAAFLEMGLMEIPSGNVALHARLVQWRPDWDARVEAHRHDLATRR